MMSTAEEVKAEMFGDNPPAGHHEVVVGRYSPGRTETGSAVAEYRSHERVNPGTIMTCEIGGHQA